MVRLCTRPTRGERKYSLDCLSLSEEMPAGPSSPRRQASGLPIFGIGKLVILLLFAGPAIGIFGLMSMNVRGGKLQKEAYARYENLGNNMEVRRAVNRCHNLIYPSCTKSSGRYGLSRFDEDLYWAAMDVEVPKSVATWKGLYEAPKAPKY